VTRRFHRMKRQRSFEDACTASRSSSRDAARRRPSVPSARRRSRNNQSANIHPTARRFPAGNPVQIFRKCGGRARNTGTTRGHVESRSRRTGHATGAGHEIRHACPVLAHVSTSD